MRSLLGGCLVGGVLLVVAATSEATTNPLAGLEPCEDMTDVHCGSITRLLDPTDPAGGKIDIAFELHPPTDSESPIGTIVAVEGGPGYSTTASRDYFIELFAPLLDRWQLLLVDNRGTGGSAPIDCPQLQAYQGDYLHDVRLCGRQLGSTSDVWGSALAADDLVAVLDHLGLERVDLYGVSYGTFFGQVFAVRHPERLRTLVLDSAFNIDQDPWYRDLNRALVDAFRRVCERDSGCAAIGGDPIERLREVADSLAAEPLTGKGYDADGLLQPVFLDSPGLSYLAGLATYGVPIYRELDAAGRAYLEGDSIPLLRIAAEQFSTAAGGPVEEYSEALYVAVSCNDYPQLWDINSRVSARPAQYREALADLRAEDADAFYPFTIDEWLQSPWTAYLACLGWPAPSTWVPPVPTAHRYPKTPTLVLVGDLDSITSPEGARIVADRFPTSTYVEIANGVHGTAISDFSRCASNLVINFVESGGDAGDRDCAGTYTEIRVVEHFPRRLADVIATAGTGNGSRGRIVTAATHTVADMMARWWTMVGEEVVGLRGGYFTTTGLERVSFEMDRLRWVEDLRVSGTVRWNRFTGAVIARVELAGASSGLLTISWNDWERSAEARARGTVGAERIDVRFPAP
jgi:pimeloyl-ACP methyl ester carboxylesterase